MIQLQNITLAFGGRTVLDSVTWTIRDNHRIGLVGPNGAGKTTLLRILTGEYQPDEGSVQLGGSTLGYLKQEVQESLVDRSVIDETMDAFEDVHSLYEQEEQILRDLDADPDHTSPAYGKLLEDLDRIHLALHAGEAHTARPRAESVLTGLGFDPDTLERPMSTFSGGWRMRVALAQLLLQRPDVLLLDEPTNHLDIDSIDWLETYLKTYPGTVLIVSHDRYFLDRMVNRIVELSRGRATEYAGNYAYYLTERTLRREMQQAAYDNQQKTIADTERFIERFKAKATKAKQAQSRMKALEKLERILPPETDEAGISFRFPEPRRTGRTVLELSAFSKTYHGKEGDVEVFDDAGPLAIERGDKIALIGRNGAGKSTLARIINGSEPFDGTRKLGKDVDITFFAQHTADSLDPSDTVLHAVQQSAPGRTETEVRSLLGAFLFSGDDVFKPVSVLSGGERSRVALAKTLMVPANFLLLDEPTNHLDIRSIAVLIEALQQYSGTFVVVSHDRHFLDQVSNRVWRAEDGHVLNFPGTYSEYLWKVRNAPAPAAAAAPDPPRPKNPPKEVPKKEDRNEPAVKTPSAGPDAEFRRINDFKLRKVYATAEADVLAVESRKSQIESDLADPSNYTDAARARATTEAYEAVKTELESLYATWEMLAEIIAERAE